MIDERKFKALAEMDGSNLVSIYIPTYRSSHNQEDQLRFKNAVKEARSQLEDRGWTQKDAESYLRPAMELLDQPRFWSYLSDGLAVFIGEDFFHQEILPLTFDQYVYIGKQFHLSPLLPVLNGGKRFYLLALSQKELRFFEGDQYSITPMEVGDLVPESMENVFEMSDLKDNLQHHSAGVEGSGNTVYHGQGRGEDDHKKDIKRYFREVNDGLMKLLYDQKIPLILACVDYLHPLYKEVNDYKYLLNDNVSGNPDEDDPVLLHEKAWAIIDGHFKSEYEKEKERFETEMAKNEASASVPDIISSAAYQKVETLFMKKGEHLYGRFNYDDNKTLIHDDYQVDDRDLLDLAAVQTHLNGGKVYLLDREDMPVPTANANAIYRFE